MGDWPIASVDDFEVSVASWRVLLYFARKDREHENLDGSTSGILPEVSPHGSGRTPHAMNEPRMGRQLYFESQ